MTSSDVVNLIPHIRKCVIWLWGRPNQDWEQDAIVALLEKVDRVVIEDPFTYIFGIVRNIVAKEWHKKYLINNKYDGVTRQYLERQKKILTPEELLILEYRKKRVRSAVAELKNSNYREILIQEYLLDKTTQEVKELMGITETQRRLLKNRAIEKLRKRVKRKYV